jgi:uncharacterized YigZ family protein
MSEHTYNTVEQTATAEYKDRGSRFLAHSFPVKTTAEVKSRLQGIKKEHPKATHHCYAYRLGTEGLQFRVSDAGEPSGSAGKPILGQIDRLEVTDVLVIVVRYFGGTLLGLPGLKNAYKSAAALALQMTPVITRHLERRYRLGFDYTMTASVLQLIRRYHGTIYHRETQLFCTLDAGIPLSNVEDCLRQFREIPGLQVDPV